jgi:hypothetical protein
MMRAMSVIIYVTCPPASKAQSVGFQFCSTVILRVVSARIRPSGGHLSQPARLRLPDSYNPRHKLVKSSLPHVVPFPPTPLRWPRTEANCDARKNKLLPLCQVNINEGPYNSMTWLND